MSATIAREPKYRMPSKKDQEVFRTISILRYQPYISGFWEKGTGTQTRHIPELKDFENIKKKIMLLFSFSPEERKTECISVAREEREIDELEEWVDTAPLVPKRLGRVKLRISATRYLKFSSLPGEFSLEDVDE